MARFTNFTVSNERLRAIWLLPWCVLLAGVGFWLVWTSRSFSYCLSLFCFAWFMLCLLELLRQIIRPENKVKYISNDVSEADVLELRIFKRIHLLNLREACLSPAGFRALAKLRYVEQLNLSASNFTDGDSDCLRFINGLQVLYLDYTSITDATLKSLEGKLTLWGLTFENTDVSEAGVVKLSKTIPGLRWGDDVWD